ncbi:MAG: hypothetical protein NW201_14965, partial [Gemmatimonadales bacterium]|nr:hypothetical protein [Gemmatimonadales bacterium]
MLHDASASPVPVPPTTAGPPDRPSARPPAWPSPGLATIEFPEVLALVAACAAGPLGAERIRARRPGTDRAALEAELALVGEVAALQRQGDPLLAAAVPDVRPALQRLRLDGAVLDASALRDLLALLVAARAVALDLRRVAERAPRAAALAVPLPEARLDRRLTDAVSPDGELLDTASPGLAQARRAVADARRRLLKTLERIQRDLGADTAVRDAPLTVRGGRYVIPMRRDSRSRPAGIVHDESGSAGTLYVEPQEAVELGNAVREAEAEAEREAHMVLRELTGLLRPAREALRDALEMVVRVDETVARARFAAQHDAHVPALHDAPGPLRLVACRHPLLLASGQPVVPFDLALEAGERVLLVSGPNTGGKTVLMKAAALAIALAQSGIVPPVGPESALPVLAACYADIGDGQSISGSLSTFSAHVAQLRRILDGADHRTLVLLDEVGSGTDPSEGAALAAAVLVALASRDALVLASTHLGALKALATESSRVVNGSLEFDEASLAPTYRFRKGVPGRSYGLAIARRLGVAAPIVADAERRVPAVERRLDQLLAAAEARQQALERAERDLELSRQLADELQARLARQEADVAAREAELARREKDAKREAARQARELLLEARQQVEAALETARRAATAEEAKEARRRIELALGEGKAREAALAASDPAPAAGGAPEVAAGDRVTLPSGLAGEVLEVRPDGKLLLRVGSMKMVADGAGARVGGRADARAR